MYSYNIGVATHTSASARAAVYCAVWCIYSPRILLYTSGARGLKVYRVWVPNLGMGPATRFCNVYITLTKK